MPDPILSLRHVQKFYTQGGNTFPVLSDIELDLYPGQMVALIGPSGSGKSTLLQIAGLLDHPTQGSVFIHNKNCAGISDKERTAIRRHSLGFVYQFHHLLPEFSALENAMMPLLIAHKPREEAEAQALSMLDRLGLSHRVHHRPAQLSGGEQQRVAIARALVHSPLLLLADEPTGNLDPHTSEQVLEVFLQAVKETKTACLVVTHNESLASRMDMTLRLSEGRVEKKPEDSVG